MPGAQSKPHMQALPVMMKLVDEKRTSCEIKYSELTIFLVFSENDNHPILILKLRKGQAVGIAESEQTSAGNLFSRDFLVDNEQQNTNYLPFRAVTHLSYPFPSFWPAGVTADFVAHRCFTPSWFVVHWAIRRAPSPILFHSSSPSSFLLSRP